MAPQHSLISTLRVSPGWDGQPAARSHAHARPTGGLSTARAGTPRRDRLGASQRDQPRSRFPCNNGIASRSRSVIERCQDPKFRSSLQAAHHRLLAHPDLPRHHVSRWGVELGHDYASPRHAAGRLGPRPRNIDQRTSLVRINRKCNDASRSNHRFPLGCPSTAYHISRTLPTPPTTYR